MEPDKHKEVKKTTVQTKIIPSQRTHHYIYKENDKECKSLSRIMTFIMFFLMRKALINTCFSGIYIVKRNQ